jgi:protein-disulfide isomerase
MRSHRAIVLSLAIAASPSGCTHPVEPGASAAPAPAVATPQAIVADPIYRVPVVGLPAMGDARALVTVVAFTDYECPYCKRAEETLSALRAAYGKDLRVVVAERPLAMHEHARPAALAALAADAQGAYEDFRRKLYGGGALDEQSLVDIARSLRLDLGRFATDRAGAGALALGRSSNLADDLNVKGTPTFFINGRLVRGAQPYETFRAVVDERLASARALLASGVPATSLYAQITQAGSPRVADGSGPDSCAAGCDDDTKPVIGDKVEAPAVAGAPARGPVDAPITIVEFSDFQCPYCARAEATIHALESAHAGQVRVIFKQRPLPMHDHARLYALAAYAAGAQGRFWEMHDRLFALQAPAERPALEAIARDLGLDADRFANDLDDPASAARLAADGADADAMAVKGTPTFFVNGLRLVGAQPQQVFEQAIEKSAHR